MDSPVITYLLKASVSIALFYGVYMLCLRKDTFLRLRRFYFIFAIIVSTVYPLTALQLSAEDIRNLPSFAVSLLGFAEEPVLQQATVEFGEMEAGYFSIAEQAEKTPIEASEILLLILISVMIILTLRFTIQLFSILKLRMNNISEKYGNCRIVRLESRKASPFSFFHWIFINITGQQEQQEIIAHEEVHARQLHSIDIILTELFCICFWWNPVAWLLRHEVKINLEYLADSGVVKDGYNTREYQYLLLQTSNVNTGISIINNFNVSQLKKRIAMMNKKESPVFLSAKYLLIIPIAIGLILSNAVMASSAISIDNEPTANEIFDNEIIPEVLDVEEPMQSFDDKPFVTVDQMPMFPGGETAMKKYIADNLKYPVKAVQDKVQGRVIIRFVVAKDGSIKDINVIRGISPECDAEAKRVIEAMPKWTPGKNKGQAVDVYYTLPIVFKLTSDNKKQAALSEPEMVLYSTPAPPRTVEAFTTVEQMPSYPGGEREMQKFIGNTMKYPVSAQTNGIQGRVLMRFVVDKDGTIKDAVVIRGVHPDLDAEAVRVINAMPKWTPGKQNGVEVPVYFTLPVTFKLANDDIIKSTNSDITRSEVSTFPGGQGALSRFMAQNLKYPVESQKNKEDGMISLKIELKATGEIINITLIGDAPKALKAEALRVAKLMPRWNGTETNNLNGSFTYVVPVIFRLQGKTPPNTGELAKVPDNAIIVIGYGS